MTLKKYDAGPRRRRHLEIEVWNSFSFWPESVSYERSRPIDRCILREISARVFFVKIPKINKNHISNISRISGKWKKLISNISRMPEHRKSPFSSISRISGNQNELFSVIFHSRFIPVKFLCMLLYFQPNSIG